MQLNNLNIAVLGAGRSGRAAARLAMKHGARVCVFDASASIGGWPEDIPLHTAATEEDGRAFHADMVVISPGIETDSPFVKSFGREGVETIGEMELACRFYHGRIIAITGTNGKTTTTSLVEKILLRAGKTAVACGNYGVPVAEILLRDSVPDVLALEVSSFQLETIRDFHPDVAVWLNFAPDHMDRYKSVEDYHRAKLHIFDNQTEKDLAVVRSGERLPHLKASVLTFSPEDPAADLYYREPLILEGGASLLNLEETALNQRHNAENAMAAVLACRHLGIPAETAAEVLKEFARTFLCSCFIVLVSYINAFHIIGKCRSIHLSGSCVHSFNGHICQICILRFFCIIPPRSCRHIINKCIRCFSGRIDFT